MNFKNVTVSNFEGAIMGMRNPLESWKRSDSYFGIANLDGGVSDDELIDIIDIWTTKDLKEKDISFEPYDNNWEDAWDKRLYWCISNGILYDTPNASLMAVLGPNDLKLAQNLVLAGTEHHKFMRQIFVSVDITAPLYWWKEFDTYKVGTTANSTSTMHKLSSVPITKEMFSFDEDWDLTSNILQGSIIRGCEDLRKKYVETNDKRYWRALIQVLPSAWLQTRTVTMNYANLRNMYFQRRNHKLIEWREDFCNWVETLPYAKELIVLENNNEN